MVHANKPFLAQGTMRNFLVCPPYNCSSYQQICDADMMLAASSPGSMPEAHAMVIGPHVAVMPSSPGAAHMPVLMPVPAVPSGPGEHVELHMMHEPNGSTA